MSSPRAELIHIEVDRRLGHEWDEWDGQPLPHAGNFDAPARLFLAWGVATMAVAVAIAAGALFLLAPRLATISSAIPGILWSVIAVAGGASLLWWLLITASYLGR